MEYLLKEDIILIDRMTVERHGGKFEPPANLLNESSLDYLIDAVQSEMFGVPMYPKVHDKAGLYMFSIVSNHVFQDGNKRTGLEAALLFLKLNGFKLKDNLYNIKYVVTFKASDQEILTEFTLELASGNITLEECQNWFRMNTVSIV